MKSAIWLKHMKLLHLNVIYEQQKRFTNLGKKKFSEISQYFSDFFRKLLLSMNNYEQCDHDGWGKLEKVSTML